MNTSTVEDLAETTRAISQAVVDLSMAIGRKDRLAILACADSILDDVKYVQDLAGRNMGCDHSY